MFSCQMKCFELAGYLSTTFALACWRFPEAMDAFYLGSLGRYRFACFSNVMNLSAFGSSTACRALWDLF